LTALLISKGYTITHLATRPFPTINHHHQNEQQIEYPKKKMNSKLSSKEAGCDDAIIGILVLFIAMLGIIAMHVAADKQPPSIKFKITEASITQFDITSDNTLYYNFKVTITAKNLKK
jgi:hypothetical protein